MDLILLLILVLSTLFLLYIYLKRRYNYWSNRGVPYMEPEFFFYGNGEKLIKEKIPFSEAFLEYYNHFKERGERHGGIYVLFAPIYIPIDPEIVRCILQKDFDHFVNRGMFVDEESDPMSGHLFSLKDAKWRNLRVKLTPTFTSGKLKMMFPIIKDCCKGLDEMLSEFAEKKEVVEAKEIIGRFTTDVIGSCAFGVECNSMKNPDADFRRYGKRIFEVTNSNKLKQIAAAITPKCIVKRLHVSFTDKEVETFFINTVRDVIAYREKNNVSRNDFLDLLIQLKKTGTVEDSTNENLKISSNTPHLTLNEITAQCYVFFAAGFETSSTTTTFALYELCTNEGIQELLREEILTVIAKHNNDVTYESILEMTYLDKVVNETLRKYPPVPVLHRVCNKSYKVPGTDVVIEPKSSVQIPIIGLHSDPEYYPNPEVFDPERFSEENKAKRPPCTFLPFGDGPRICIGLRFGKLQTKLALITILRNYRITLNEKTKTPIQMKKSDFISSVEGGVWLNFSKL